MKNTTTAWALFKWDQILLHTARKSRIKVRDMLSFSSVNKEGYTVRKITISWEEK